MLCSVVVSDMVATRVYLVVVGVVVEGLRGSFFRGRAVGSVPRLRNIARCCAL